MCHRPATHCKRSINFLTDNDLADLGQQVLQKDSFLSLPAFNSRMVLISIINSWEPADEFYGERDSAQKRNQPSTNYILIKERIFQAFDMVSNGTLIFYRQMPLKVGHRKAYL
jgi:hypothetical protein